MLTTAALCNNARLIPPVAYDDSGDGKSEPRWTILGDPTEAALRVVAAKAGLNITELEESLPRIHELPFESRRRRMSTLHRRPTLPGVRTTPPQETIAFVKGAPKEILSLCADLWHDGRAEPLTDALRSEIVAANDGMARAGLRVLAVARRTLPAGQATFDVDSVECDLAFMGLLGMMDPPREEVTQAVELCRRAGIRIIMITGDYGLTAESIARRIGIVRTLLPRIVTGAELDGMDDEALRQALAEEVIFARAAPEHKLRIVTVLQELGNVVAVTGDGVNDAPALKKADIGIAMGITGTDVAKEAAEMVLTDDNFASIVSAIEEGRAVFANIKKFTSYILTSNTPEAVPFILFVLTAGRIPLALNVMQILSIDLGTDIVPALALGCGATGAGRHGPAAASAHPARHRPRHAAARLWTIGHGPERGLHDGVLFSLLDQRLLGPVAGSAGQRLGLPCSGRHGHGRGRHHTDRQRLCPPLGDRLGLPVQSVLQSAHLDRHCHRADLALCAHLRAVLLAHLGDGTVPVA